ncbi:RrF2 family transcriptional regulator [Thermosipho atlanticus]|uniref:Transcriptional regulator, BadM/Rrf2 family n=1 Tax=Thermosipho atlanticus DSM 15807 TaxID=1123380 RepID=A0A1M5S487_9BACT|nr:Rrf2 family transcriptional regulator [Thermosipho atlanticus]SHH33442.1 transcriptional regulator, BadM/Rrf2 family [Thermosipho atlanticus DSM 15807]
MFGKCQKDIRYSVRILIRLSLEEKPINSKAISELENISRKYAMKLLFYLKEANLVKTIRGKNGGYTLVKDPHEIYLIDITRTFKSNIEIVSCPKDCPNHNFCKARKFWKWLNKEVFKLLSSTSLKDIIDGNFKNYFSFQ